MELKGLDIDVPPKTHFAHKAAEHWEEQETPLLRFEVENIQCDGADLTLETDKPGKLSLVFDIAHIKLNHVRPGHPRAVPCGVDQSPACGNDFHHGRHGSLLDGGGPRRDTAHRQLPIRTRKPGRLLKGIAGTLQSTGSYEGVLRDLVVDGQTDTPDFRLTSFGTAMPLHTEFHAHVDGTNGDTKLEPVNATLGQSHFTAEGEVVRIPPGTASNGTATPGGHVIALNVKVTGGRMEDFLRSRKQERHAAADRHAGAEGGSRNSAGICAIG